MRIAMFGILTTLMMAAGASPSLATTVSDPAGDFLSSFTGPHNADLDVRSFTVDFDRQTQDFVLSATLNGPINSKEGGKYVIGVDTGTGALAPFASIGEKNVKFNQTITLNQDGTSVLTGTTGKLGADAITILGSSFTVDVPVSFLPSTGFDPSQFGFTLWPASGAGVLAISDFSPDNSSIDFGLSTVPLPPALPMFGAAIIGLGMVGYGRNRKRAAAAA